MKSTLNLTAGLLAASVLLFAACSDDSSSASSSAPEYKEYANLKEALSDISAIKTVQTIKAAPDFSEAYELQFKQPVSHNDTAGENFNQKMIIQFRGFEHPTVLITCGYALNFCYREGKINDLASNMGANEIYVEYRYFGESKVENDPKWEHLTIEEAANDLHNIYLALKPAFHKEWVSTGTSKDGMNTVHYRYYYPDDMDVSVAFSAPLMTNIQDERIRKYFHDSCGTEQERELMETTLNRIYDHSEDIFYPLIKERLSIVDPETAPKFDRMTYLDVIGGYFFCLFSYSNEKVRDSTFTKLANITNEDLVILLTNTYLENKVMFGYDSPIYPYEIQSAKEIGLYGVESQFKDFRTIVGFEDVQKDSVRTVLKPEDRWLFDTYNNSVTKDILDNFLPKTETPILMVYAKDDPWTGGRPAKVNDPKVKIIMNPIGIHADFINSRDYFSEETTNEIMDFVAQYVKFEKSNTQRNALTKSSPDRQKIFRYPR